MGIFEDGLAFFNNEHFILLDYGIGDVIVPEEWNQMKLYNPHHMFYYMIEGQFEVTDVSSHNKTIITPGHSFLIPSGVYDFECSTPSKVFATHFLCPLKNGSDLLAPLFANVTEIKISRDNYALNNILNCFEQKHITADDIVLFKGLIQQIVGQALKESGASSLSSSLSHYSHHVELIVQIMSYVKKHLSAKLKVSDVAKQFNYHPNYLSKLFYKENGITLKHYIEVQLYRKALIMLTISNKSVSCIASELDFSSQFHFSNFVKKHLGSSPEVFRKSQGALRTHSK